MTMEETALAIKVKGDGYRKSCEEALADLPTEWSFDIAPVIAKTIGIASRMFVEIQQDTAQVTSAWQDDVASLGEHHESDLFAQKMKSHVKHRR